MKVNTAFISIHLGRQSVHCTKYACESKKFYSSGNSSAFNLYCTYRTETKWGSEVLQTPLHRQYIFQGNQKLKVLLKLKKKDLQKLKTYRSLRWKSAFKLNNDLYLQWFIGLSSRARGVYLKIC